MADDPLARPPRPLGRRQTPVDVMEVLTREGDLLEVVQRLHAGRGAADLLDRRQEQRDQDRDDGDDDQQLDERNSAAAIALGPIHAAPPAARGSEHDGDQTTPATTTILAIDLAKHKSVVCRA